MAIRFPDITPEQMQQLQGRAQWIPVVIPAGETFVVPAGKQALFAEDIEIEGDLVIDGDLVEVS